MWINENISAGTRTAPVNFNGELSIREYKSPRKRSSSAIGESSTIPNVLRSISNCEYLFTQVLAASTPSKALKYSSKKIKIINPKSHNTVYRLEGKTRPISFDHDKVFLSVIKMTMPITIIGMIRLIIISDMF